jgi:YVTN family beta-propeller protein
MMGNGKYIGRVGGLAVALGVGIAVATTPGVAWADETASTSPGETTGTAGAAGASGPSESQATSTTIGTTAEPAATSTAAGTETEGASAPGSGSGNASESGTSASTGASVRQVPPGMAMSTGGADSSTKSNSETSANGDQAAALTTDGSALPKPVAASTARHSEAPAAATAPVRAPGGGSNKQRRVNDPTGAPGVDANTVTATGNAVPSRPEISPPPRTVVDVAVPQPAAQRPVTAVTARTYLPSQADVVAQAISAARTEPTEPPSTVSAVVLAALATAGLGPLAPNGPLTPVDSPLELALMAVGARPRQIGQGVDEETRSPSVSPTLTSQTIDTFATADQQTFAAMATAPSALTMKAAASPTKPDTTAPTVSFTAPATVSGTVTLSATATDNAGGSGVAGVQFKLDGANLGTEDTSSPYSMAWNTTTVANGTHTLTAVARDAAGNTTTSTVTVTVANPAPSDPGQIMVGQVPVAVAVSGNRAYIANAYDGTVSVIDTTTNTVVKTLGVGSSPQKLAVSPDGERVYVANTGSNTVSIIDASTDTVIGTVVVPVQQDQPGVFLRIWDVAANPLGGRVYVTATGGTVFVIDTATNAVSGPYRVGPAATGVAISPDGSRLYVATELWNSDIEVVDTASMTVIGTINLGESSYPIDGAFTPDGKRLYMITGAQGSETADNAVMVIDTDPNSTTYNTVIHTIYGGAPGHVVFSQDGSRAYVSDSGDNTITVIDTHTNAVIGTLTVNLSPASGSRDEAISADGTTLYVTDSAGNAVYAVAIADTELATTRTSIAVNGYPGDVAVSGNYVYVFNGTDAGAVWVIDPTTNSVVGDPIPVGINPTGMVASERGDRVYVADYGYYGDETGVAVIDTDPTSPTYHEVTFIPVTVEDPPYYCECFYGVKGIALSADGSRVYAYADDAYVSVIDTATKTVISRRLIGSHSELVVSEDGTRLYAWPYQEVYGSTSTQVHVYDTATMTKVGTVAVTPEYTAHDVAVTINSDGTRAYAVVRDPSSYDFKLSVIDIDPNSSTYNNEIAVIDVPSRNGVTAIDIALNSDGSRAYVLNHDGQVAVIDTATNQLIGTFTVNDPGTYAPGSIAVGADGTIYVTDYYRSAVYAVTVGQSAQQM